MRSSAHIDSDRALFDFSVSLGSFADGSRQVMAALRRALAVVQEWLHGREEAWQREVARCRAALEGCLAAAERDERADCAAEAAALERAKEELRNVREWIARVAHAAQAYDADTERFLSVLGEAVPLARIFLAQKSDIVQAYGSTAGLPGAGASTIASSTAATGGLLAAGAFAGMGTAAGGAGGGAAAPTYTINGRSFTDVSVRMIETPAFAPGEWEQADYADMQHSFSRLPAIQQAIRNGTIDQLCAADADARRVYDWFYGGNAVQLDWYQGQYTIGNGKHRVTMARILGLPNLPAIVHGVPVP